MISEVALVRKSISRVGRNRFDRINRNCWPWIEQKRVKTSFLDGNRLVLSRRTFNLEECGEDMTALINEAVQMKG